jgi:pimeloyl-ACP methyl ester carboxylesterase
MNIFLIPGNPPASYFYQKWLAELEQAGAFKSSHFHIYPTFKQEKNQQAYWQGVLNFYQEKLSNLDEVILIGHSVGGKVALDLMQKNPLNVKKCFLLFPFLRSPGPRGKLVLEGVSRLHQLVGTGVFLKKQESVKYFF